MKYLVLIIKFCLIILVIMNCSHRKEKPVRESEPVTVIASACKNVVIDGKSNEWSGKEILAVDKRASIGVCYDNDYIYSCFITRDPEISMQMMNFGCSIWFNPAGAFQKTGGIQFPVYQNVPPPPRDAKPPSGKELQAFLDKRLEKIVIYDDKGTAKSMTRQQALSNGIEVQIGIHEGQLCYEMKYPRHPKSGIGVVLTEKSFAMCIKTPEVDLQKLMKDANDQQKMAPDQPSGKQLPPPGQPQKKGDTGNKRIRPKPPQFTPVSQWIRVTLKN
ncbi:MAG TPA: hypothetical protein VHI78_00805 [Bacteroidales bacterium]|nr:hypothetical protein [Bacteroidales bacterium]